MKHTLLHLLAGTGASLALLSCSTSVYDATDTNQDGRISTDEVEELLIDAVFASDDANNDGKVTLEEWKAANPNDDVAKFKVRDANGDGVISKDEFAAHAKGTGMFDKFIAELDPSKDGTVSNADFDAFAKKHNIKQ